MPWHWEYTLRIEKALGVYEISKGSSPVKTLPGRNNSFNSSMLNMDSRSVEDVLVPPDRPGPYPTNDTYQLDA
jgi:hypothetical protein